MFKTNLFCLRHTMTKFVVPTQMYKIQYAIQYDELSLSNPGVREDLEDDTSVLPIKTFSEKVYKEMTLKVTLHSCHLSL